MTLSDYLALITSEHQDKPDYIAVITALMSGPTDITNLDLKLPSYFDLDTATGAQLDAVGQWVGITRRVTIPLSGVYFEWDGTSALLGWNLGNWRGPFDPAVGIVDLTDSDYRTLLRGKIAANTWDGTIPAAVAALRLVFPEQFVVVQDNQDMSMDILFIGPPLTAVERALILGDYLLLRPFTVQVHTYSIQPIEPFGEDWLTWDATAQLGWGTAFWRAPLLTWGDGTTFTQPVPNWMTWDGSAAEGWSAYWFDPLFTYGWGHGPFTPSLETWLTWDDTSVTGWGSAFWYTPLFLNGWGDAHWARGGPVFAWETETLEFSGWNEGAFIGALLP